MPVRLLFSCVVVMTQIAAAGETQWVKKFSFVGSNRWDISTAYAISADSQVLVFRRDEHRDTPRKEAWRHELVYVDLVTGQERAVLQLSDSGYARLGVSRDGRQVAVLHAPGGADWRPFFVSVWQPLSGEQLFKNYTCPCYELMSSEGATESIEGTPFGDPVFSPDGTKVAFFGRHIRQNRKTGTEGATDAVGVLNLGSGRSVAFDLPFLTKSQTSHYWYLGWGENGLSICAIAHGDYRETVHEKTATGYSEVHQSPPDWAAYRCSLADGGTTLVGGVPLSTLGFGANDAIIVSDVDTERESLPPSAWHRTGFGLVPINRLEQLGHGGSRSVQALALATTITKITAPREENNFRLSEVFVGKAHTFVVGWMNGVRVVLEHLVGDP